MADTMYTVDMQQRKFYISCKRRCHDKRSYKAVYTFVFLTKCK